MPVRPALVTHRRPSDGLAKPNPKPEPFPDPDEDDEAAIAESQRNGDFTVVRSSRDQDLAALMDPYPRIEGDQGRRPPLPAGVGHFPPKLPVRSAALVEFPVPKARERSVSKSVRVPVSMLDALEAICRERGIEFSALVLHYVAEGLRRPFAPENPAS